MLLRITTTHTPATDLGYLLLKHPDRVGTFPLTFGAAHVFWPEAGPDRATAVMYVEVDPIWLARRSRPDDPRPLRPYVNDRPYVASSFLSVAIAEVYGTALAGRSRERPELADTPIPLEIELPTIVVRGGEAIVRELFGPLGYEVDATPIDGRLFSLRFRATRPLHDVLGHLYVLVPVLDDEKHYWVGDDEVDKLLRHGEGWLEEHPSRDTIVRRYLKHRGGLFRSAVARMSDGSPLPDDPTEEALEAQVSLAEHRFRFVVRTVQSLGGRRVLDLGCGEGKLVKRLLQDKTIEAVGGTDVSPRALERARERLGGEEGERLSLFQGSVTYRDARLRGWDVATCIEVVEHVDPERLPAFEDAILADAAPRHLVLTTPNAEYNVRFPVSGLRHPDHRFEWTRGEFRAWAERMAVVHGYTAAFYDVGPADPELGPPTQAVVLSRGAR